MRTRRPQSKWRIITPLILLTLFVPSFVLAYACATDQGPWAPNGYFSAGTPNDILLLLSPLAVWAAGWLWPWEGDHDVLEPRAIVCTIAGAISLAICAVCAFDMYMVAFAAAHA